MEPPFSTDFSTPDDSPGLLLWQVSNLWQRRQRAALEPLGLTHAQFVALAVLVWQSQAGDPPTQAQLAQHTRLDTMLLSDVLRALERKGLVERRPHPADSRANAVTATEAGRALAREAVPVVEATDREFFAALGADAGQVAELLRRLRDARR